MTLPFSKDTGRKWQCFICGKSHNDFESFKTHIMETHDEGREYIVCPLERCGAPIRDVRLHFKVIHKTEKPPKQGQMRALIWKDPLSGGKRTKKPSFREGYIVSLKNNGKEFFYRSSYECEVFECLEVLPDVIAYDVEPFKQGIPYLFNGKSHKYHPDLSIKFSDGTVAVWEIKPANQTHLPLNEAKWSAAGQYCRARGWDFVVVTEVGINKLKKKVRDIKRPNAF